LGHAHHQVRRLREEIDLQCLQDDGDGADDGLGVAAVVELDRQRGLAALDLRRQAEARQDDARRGRAAANGLPVAVPSGADELVVDDRGDLDGPVGDGAAVGPAGGDARLDVVAGAVGRLVEVELLVEARFW